MNIYPKLILEALEKVRYPGTDDFKTFSQLVFC